MKLAVGCVITASLLSGCATILNDSTQPVAFSSDPQGAVVKVDGVAMGRTPTTIPVPRKGWDKQLQFELDGYKTAQMTLKNTLSGAAAGNLILGGLVGGVVDGISGRGGGYQGSVHIVLEPGSGFVTVEKASDADDSTDEDNKTSSTLPY